MRDQMKLFIHHAFSTVLGNEIENLNKIYSSPSMNPHFERRIDL